MTKNELKNKEYQISEVVSQLNYKKLRIIIGNEDRITPLDEIKEFVQKPLNDLDLVIINNMTHDSFQEDYVVKINEEIKKSFFLNY